MSVIGAILLGVSGDGVRARFRVETAKPMMKKEATESCENSTCTFHDRKGTKLWPSEVVVLCNNTWKEFFEIVNVWSRAKGEFSFACE